MDRRSFFSFLPIAPVVVAAAVVSESSKDDTPEDKNHLVLHANNRYVTFGVGRDGNLWIKPHDDNWKKVATV